MDILDKLPRGASLDHVIQDLISRRAVLSRTGENSLALTGQLQAGAILRDLLDRHSGPLPPRTIVQIWSDILFVPDREASLHVFGRENAPGFWDLARIHFGCVMPMTSHGSAAAVVHACADDPAAIGIVPVPESVEDEQAWWEQLAPVGSSGPRIAQSLPFVLEDGGLVPLPRGYAIASIEQEAVGTDTTILRFECEGELSRTRLQTLLRQAGFDSQILSASRGTPGGVPSRVLVANTGYVAANDERITSIASLASDAIASVAIVGGFANPYDAAPAAKV